ncbi:MerR family transcriptional regulator [Actinacidiphila acididurans]|uniref:MerR family transcriptional regulator n=1 Tax=Actinacidiphila acididurans TaxID=2784346 RepID=A0ABS2TZ11_9ACTN|nr:MerR family transcriptional regulator [Actinacidiphila acididurans]MBM9507545.1 MerR family transcriptional regulator [Actinacidiphila acididurans]
MPQTGLTIDELAARAGVTVRTVRFYSARGLLPPPAIGPRRIGRYGPEHQSRLALIGELQHQGLTLAAIERYFQQLPPDISAHDLAIHRALVSSWLPEGMAGIDREKLEHRVGRPLTEADLDRLEAMNVLERTGDPDAFRVDPGTLHLGVRLLDMPIPVEALVEAREAMMAHARAAAREISRIFLAEVWRPDRPSQMRSLSAQMQPLVVQALVTTFQRALREEVRAWPAAGPDTHPGDARGPRSDDSDDVRGPRPGDTKNDARGSHAAKDDAMGSGDAAGLA